VGAQHRHLIHWCDGGYSGVAAIDDAGDTEQQQERSHDSATGIERRLAVKIDWFSEGAHVSSLLTLEIRDARLIGRTSS
jgi:hypothetical protein